MLKRNILSLEEIGEELISTLPEKVSSNELESANSIDELVEASNDIKEYTYEVEEVLQEVDSLQTTSDNITTNLKDENYQGLDEVSVELLKYKLSRLEKKGFKIQDSLNIAKEDFSTSAFNRRQQTEISNEGIGDFISGIIGKIGKVINSMFSKIGELWNNYVSILGSIEHTILSNKNIIQGKIKSHGNLTISPSDPSNKQETTFTIRKAFPVGRKIDSNVVNQQLKYMDGHFQIVLDVYGRIWKTLSEIKTKMNGGITKGEVSMIAKKNGLLKPIVLGTPKAPLANGLYRELKFNIIEDKLVIDESYGNVDTSGEGRYFTVTNLRDLEKITEQELNLLRNLRRFGEDVYNKTADINQSFENVNRTRVTDEMTEKDIKATSISISRLFNIAMFLYGEMFGLSLMTLRGTNTYISKTIPLFK